MRESLGLRDWEKAQELIRKWESEGCRTAEPDKPQPVTIEDSFQKFLQDAEARNLREPTIYKYRLLFRQTQAFVQAKGLRFVKEFTLDLLREFRASWPNRNLSATKKLDCLRAFFRFAHESDWIAGNPASKLKNPKVSASPTMPFTREEVIRTLAACDRYPDNYGRTGQENGRRLKALVLLLRYSGLRIQDAVTISKERVVDDKLFLCTAKTGTQVYCPLPNSVIEALEAISQTNRRYFFWSGESKPKSAVGNWQRSLKKLFQNAGIPEGHAHRFRHSFAVELLLAGVPLERVSVLLGHQSIKVTEKHYAPWVRARQEQLEADVRRVWGNLSTATPATKGTREVRGGSSGILN